MTQGFDEYLDINYNEKIDDLTKLLIHDAYKAGAASRQTEIDELQKRIDDALDYVFGLYCTGDLDTERLENILKGESNE